MRALLASVVALGCAVLAGEGVLRVLDGYQFSHLRLTPRGSVVVPAGPAAPSRTATREMAANGTDASWYDIEPVPLAPRRLPDDLAAFAQEATAAGASRADAMKAWNPRFLQDSVCIGSSVFHGFPGMAFTYEPSEAGPYPRYRYFPSVTTPDGLTTNQLGFRGHDLSIDKPADVVRIAFVGASTTVGSHSQPFSYPEYLEPWLNRWAAASGAGVRFETINSGREGLTSSDIAAIVRQEVAPLAPDLVVYYEGANQFSVRAMIDQSDRLAAPPQVVSPPTPLPGVGVSAFMRRLDILARRAKLRAGREPRKPLHRLLWPDGVDEREPDPDSVNLPLDLPRIVHDLDDIVSTANRVGARVALLSFLWFAEDGLVIDPVDRAYFLDSLNRQHWPATYAEVRRMADFQNRVFARYAHSRGLTFIDYAARFPRDPQWFTDGVHLTAEGDRLHAWVVFQELVPHLPALIAARRAQPRPVVPPPPTLTVTRSSLTCTDYASFSIAQDVPLTALQVSPGAIAESGRPGVVETPLGRNAYAVSAPVRPGVSGPGVVHVRLKVVTGKVSIGTMTTDAGRWLSVSNQSASADPADVYLPVARLEDLGLIMISNAVVADGQRSRVEIDSVAVLKPAS